MMEENEDVWDLWLAVQTQWRGAGLGIVGLDYGTVYRVAESMGIEMSPCNLKKIGALERAELEKMNRKENTTIQTGRKGRRRQ